MATVYRIKKSYNTYDLYYMGNEYNPTFGFEQRAKLFQSATIANAACERMHRNWARGLNRTYNKSTGETPILGMEIEEVSFELKSTQSIRMRINNE